MERTFKALADGNRRTMLDVLREEPGTTVGEMAARFAMTRYAVMKHLKTLEGAGLVVSRRSGRERHLYLNAVPLREIQERWLGRYAAHWSDALLSFKHHMERHHEQTEG